MTKHNRDGKIVGAEALARWIHPVYGFMSPAEFIPLFEENGMIADLDRHIWKSACKTLADWEKKLKDMPVDVLKIDMKFLSKTGDERKADIIVKNVIRLSDDLDITSLAEGVETEKHFNKLNGFGCTLFLGYYFSKPLPLEEFEAMLKE